MDEAIAHWGQASEIDPRLAGAHLNLGTVLLGKGQVDEAIAHLEKALAVEPSLASAHNSLGNALLRKGKGPANAVPHFREALRLRPDFARAHCGLGAPSCCARAISEALTHYQACRRCPANQRCRAQFGGLGAGDLPGSHRSAMGHAVELADAAPAGCLQAKTPQSLARWRSAYARGRAIPGSGRGGAASSGFNCPSRQHPQAEALRAQLQSYQAGTRSATQACKS